MIKKTIIAIDGPAASGKGTLARELAKRLNFAYMDTGSLYRAMACYLKQEPLDDYSKIDHKKLIAYSFSDVIRTEEIGALASKISKKPEVREYLLGFQKDFAYYPPEAFDGVILDGRDIGTIICPDADFKFFVTASAEVRAQRRYKELKDKEKDVTFDAILQEVEMRDQADRNRLYAPLIPADDAIILDNSTLSIEACIDFCLDKIQKKG